MRALLEVACVEIMGIHKESVNEMSEDELGEKLYKYLWGERYLIIMDDVWDIEVYDRLRLFFPNNGNGSRIMITTRLANLALQLSNSYSLNMKFLDEDACWNLLCKIVFGNENCPSELVGIGKTIARNCNGLPLSIVVIGGLLAKSTRTREYWDYISQDLSSIVNSEDKEHCLKVLHTSYRQLPLHLKPCFLYMGMFPENRKIRISRLIMQLVGEGFLKPISGKSYEEVAEDYIRELIDRNLIIVDSYCCSGKVKVCRMHDLLRDICLKEAKKHKFFSVLTEESLRIPQEMISERRCVCIYDKRRSEEEHNSPDQVFECASFARSLIWEFQPHLPSFTTLSLLRVCSVADEIFPEAIFEQVNLRYLFLGIEPNYLLPKAIPPSISLLWNLEILVVVIPNAIIPSQIWKMPMIRHVVFTKARLPHPPIGDDNVLSNLQTLEEIHSFQCSEEVVKRIPNIKKLKIYYEDFFTEEGPRSCISNLGRLHKLESVGIVIDPFPDVEQTQRHLEQNLTFPHSLKKLCIGHTRLQWEDLNAKIGSLPLLEVLKLKWQSFVGPKWETVEGNFCSLKFLLVEYCDLEHWATDYTHFPCLERLVLRDLPLLEEIDSRIGHILTLGLIELACCTKSAVISAKTLLEEQEEYGNVSIQVRVLLSEENTALECLATSNFQFYH